MKIIFVFVAGNIGVGKTTVSKLIARLLSATHVDIDGFKSQVVDAGAVSETIDPLELRNRYCELAVRHHLADSSGVVVMDEIFPFKAQREHVSRVAREADAEVVWVNVVASEDTVLNRLTFPRSGHLLDMRQARSLHDAFNAIFEAFEQALEPHIQIENDGTNPHDIVVPNELLRLRDV